MVLDCEMRPGKRRERLDLDEVHRRNDHLSRVRWRGDVLTRSCEKADLLDFPARGERNPHENDPNRDASSIVARKRMGVTDGASGATGEHAGQRKRKGAIEYGGRKGNHVDRGEDPAAAPGGTH